jgi:hypothetical protein
LGSWYKDKLLEQILPENLPSIFGGKCTCVGGCSMSDAGPWNPHGGEGPADGSTTSNSV